MSYWERVQNSTNHLSCTFRLKLLPETSGLGPSRGFRPSIPQLTNRLPHQFWLTTPWLACLPLLRVLNQRWFVVVSLHNWNPCFFRGNLEIRVIPRVLSHKSVRFSGKNYRRWKSPSCRLLHRLVIWKTGKTNDSQSHCSFVPDPQMKHIFVVVRDGPQFINNHEHPWWKTTWWFKAD